MLTTMERACVPAMWVGWSRGASKGALLEFVHGVRAHAKVAPLRLDVGDLEPSSSVVITRLAKPVATLQPPSDQSVVLLTWPGGGFAVA